MKYNIYIHLDLHAENKKEPYVLILSKTYSKSVA